MIAKGSTDKAYLTMLQQRPEREGWPLPSSERAVPALPVSARKNPIIRGMFVFIMTAAAIMGAVALLTSRTRIAVTDADAINDVICKHRTGEDGTRPAHCPALPSSTSKEAVKEIRDARASIESELRKLAAPAPLPREQQFRIEPTTWMNGQLGLKLSADSQIKGALSIGVCDRFAAMYSWVGDAALDVGKAEKAFRIGFKEPSAVLIAQVRPQGAQPFAVVSTWDLSNLTMMKHPIVKDGVFDCREIMGK